MDTPNLLVLLAVSVLLIVAPRLAYRTVGLTGDFFAQLFVPPDRALGWPHGVQESDAPWGWNPTAMPDPTDVFEATIDPQAPSRPDLLDLGELPMIRTGSYVVPVHPVDPTRTP
jgi:hypothetical protein